MKTIQSSKLNVGWNKEYPQLVLHYNLPVAIIVPLPDLPNLPTVKDVYAAVVGSLKSAWGIK